MSLTEWTQVAMTDELPDGEMIGVDVGAVKICLARVNGTYYAMNDVCTHFATRLSGGELFADQMEVECPLHDSKFSFLDGEPHQVPADKPVEVYGVRVEGDGIVVGPAR